MVKKTKENLIHNLFEEHIEFVDETLSYMLISLEYYLNSDINQARDFSYKTHLTESKADTKRRQIIETMYNSPFLSPVKKDLIKYIARQDKIADKAESTTDFLITQTPKIPTEFNQDILRLAKMSYNALSPLKIAMASIFTDYSKIYNAVRDVNAFEEEIDTLEWHITKNIFQNKELDLAEKKHLHALIYHIVHISDVIEDASDMLDSFVVKKRI